MRLLLDTHIALGAATDQARLTAGERALLADPTNPLLFSAVSLWELRLKWNSLHASGERKGAANPDDVLAFATDIGWELMPLTPLHAVALLREPLAHKDPFDELLLVQAQEEGCRLVSRDGQLVGHPLVVAG